MEYGIYSNKAALRSESFQCLCEHQSRILSYFKSQYGNFAFKVLEKECVENYIDTSDIIRT